MRPLFLMVVVLLLASLNGCAGRTPPPSMGQAGQCFCECDPSRGSYSYSKAARSPFQGSRGNPQSYASAVGGAAATPLPPVVSSRFQGGGGPSSVMPKTPRGKMPAIGNNAMGAYKQAKADARRSAKRRQAAKKRTLSKEKRKTSKPSKSIVSKKSKYKKASKKKSNHKKSTHKKVGKAYKVLGQWYTPLASSKGYNETGKASWYGKRFHGGPTASGEKFDMNALTAAHKTLPFNSKVKITNLETNSNIIVRINDRGPFRKGYIIDVSAAAADRLGYNGKGDINVRVEGVE